MPPQSGPSVEGLVLNALLESAAAGIVSITSKGIVRTINAAALKMFGYDADEIVGHNISLLMQGSDRANHDSYIERYLQTGQSRIVGVGREVTGRRKDGNHFPLHLSIGEFRIGEDIEAGLVLTGTEVKSLRKGQANIAESYASVEEGELWLINAYIAEYPEAGPFFQHEPRRKRKLLISKRELHKLAIAIDRKGMTLVPLSIYFNAKGRAKLRLALAEGKKLHDKREDAAKRDWNRQKARLMREKG